MEKTHGFATHAFHCETEAISGLARDQTIVRVKLIRFSLFRCATAAESPEHIRHYGNLLVWLYRVVL